MWPFRGPARFPALVKAFRDKSSFFLFLAIIALIPLFHSCSLDSIRNSPGHRAMYYYDSIQDARIREDLRDRGYLPDRVYRE